ncbi:MAG TPA: tetratricopeptide repeat protein [Burkholderiaceae bacterium]|nr:tetratricopeptide repeat protein [Burkholderiaceae bacterium]
MKQLLVHLVSAAVIALALQQGAFAADTPEPAAPDKLAQARGLIKNKKWVEAIDELKRVNDPASADWNNLMGYSLRKASAPDLAGAERHYNEALRIKPDHRGALEYSGELYLIKGDLAAAEKRLAVLDKACMFGCEEYTDLKKAIERYKAAGNKYVAAQ